MSLTEKWNRLNAALQDTTPPCHGDARFVADQLEPHDLLQMRVLCQQCPVREACADYYRAARPAGVFAAGRHYTATPGLVVQVTASQRPLKKRQDTAVRARIGGLKTHDFE